MHQGDGCSPHRRVVQFRDVRDSGPVREPEWSGARDATSVGARCIGKATGEFIIRPSNVNRTREATIGESAARQPFVLFSSMRSSNVVRLF